MIGFSEVARKRNCARRFPKTVVEPSNGCQGGVRGLPLHVKTRFDIPDHSATREVRGPNDCRSDIARLEVVKLRVKRGPLGRLSGNVHTCRGGRTVKMIECVQVRELKVDSSQKSHLCSPA